MFLSEPKKTQPLELDAGEEFPTVHLSAQGPITHRIALCIEQSMAKSRADNRGILSTKLGRVIPSKIMSEGLARALSILDALFSALDRPALAMRKREATVAQRALDALSAFLDGIVRETRNAKILHAGGPRSPSTSTR